ncbi:hypothetical protein D3C75_588750 [compost metagenome]
MNHSGAGILIHTKNMGHPEVGVIAFNGGRLVNPDERAAFVYPFGQKVYNFAVIPVLTAAPG